MFPTQTQTAEMLRHNDAAGRLDAPAETTRVELVLEGQAEGAAVAIKYLTWTEGLGWCCQKTIKVGADQLDELHRAVIVARHRVRRQSAEAGAPTQTARVIQLPALS